MCRCNDIDYTDAVMSSSKSILKADEIMQELISLEDKQKAGTITKAEIKRMSSLMSKLTKILKQKKVKLLE